MGKENMGEHVSASDHVLMARLEELARQELDARSNRISMNIDNRSISKIELTGEKERFPKLEILASKFRDESERGVLKVA